MKPWQIRIFTILFRPLRIPLWVTGNSIRLADLLLALFGLTAGFVSGRRRALGVAFIIFAIGIALLMLIWHIWIAAIIDQRNHRIAQGLCLNCGYDLRATPDKCPECGLVPQQQT